MQNIAPGTVETVASHVEAHTATWLAVAAAVGPTLALGAVVFVVVKYGLPAWREESKANREHLADLVAQRGKEALEDVAAGRELAKVQQQALVDKIGGRVDEVHAKVSGIHDVVRSIANKLGAASLALLLLLSSFAVGATAGRLAVVMWRRQLEPPPAFFCNPPCKAPASCCAKDTCCRNAHSETYAGLKVYGDDIASATEAAYWSNHD